MGHHPLVGPVVALLAWSIVMLIWVYTTRIPAMVAAGVDLKNRVGGGGSDLDKVLPPKVQWKSHNYNHLMEQPTLFYAACFALMALAAETPAAIYAAWGYVGLRVVHSLIQSISNRIRYRFLVFMLASLCLILLVGLAVIAALR
ncbi:MAPEG family protein [Sphingomonas jaspsi]|uniref:MAPEG family protein n=1 Tax=Sphingomonas jaspsi TaxID=392409 RepID=UPI0004B1E015|nr:MAPEG family protein [Sphingomonas jaspsi]